MGSAYSGYWKVKPDAERNLPGRARQVYIPRRNHQAVVRTTTTPRTTARAGKVSRPARGRTACRTKKRFPNQAEALVFASRMLRKPHCERERFQAYHCDQCDGWHLSHWIKATAPAA